MQRRRGGNGHPVSPSAAAAAVIIVGGERGSAGDGCDVPLGLRGIGLPDEAAAADAEFVRGSLADDSLGRGLSRDDTGDTSSVGGAKVSCSKRFPQIIRGKIAG